MHLTEAPSSPIQGLNPKWLTSSRNIGGARYIIKIVTLAIICIVLGWSVSGLERNDAAQQRDTEPLNLPQETLSVDNGRFGLAAKVPGYLDQTYRDSSRGIAKSPSKSTPSGASPNTLRTSWSDKIFPWKPWAESSKSKGQDAQTLDRLYGDGALQETGESFTTPATATGQPPSLAKITIVTGGDNSAYERALQTHAEHNKMHGYAMLTLRQSILNDVWSKPAYILSVILRELAKPKAERLQWLFWVDADTIIINPYIPAEIFLPPVGWDDVHLLVSHDFNGLNNGVFPIRVHSWSVELLAAVISFPSYNPDQNLLFRDQSAMAELLKTPKFARHTVQTPQRWFNAYQGEINETIAPFQTRPGDLLVHFAGVPNRDERMEWWLRRAELHLPEWEIEFKHTTYKTETVQFWDELRRTKQGIKKDAEELKKYSMEKMEMLKKAVEEYNTVLTEDQKGKLDKSIEAMRKVFDNDDTKENIDSIKKAMENMREGAIPLQALMDKENKVLIGEAHNALFEAEKIILMNEESTATQEEFNRLEEAISHFKDLLVKKIIRPDSIRLELEILKNKKQDFEQRVETVRREKAIDSDLREILDPDEKKNAVVKAKLKEEVEAKRKQEEEKKAMEEAEAKLIEEAKAKKKQEEEKKTMKEAQAELKQEIEAKMRQEEDAIAMKEAEARAKMTMVQLGKGEAEVKAKSEVVEAKANAEGEKAQSTQEAELKGSS